MAAPVLAACVGSRLAHGVRLALELQPLMDLDSPDLRSSSFNILIGEHNEGGEAPEPEDNRIPEPADDPP